MASNLPETRSSREAKTRGIEEQQVEGGDPSPCCVLTHPLSLPSITFLEEERSCCFPRPFKIHFTIH